METDAVSDRVFKSIIYSEQDLQKAYEMDHNESVDLKTFEIAFDRTCQLACSYCNASFSTTWAKDITKNGAYQNMVSDGAAHFNKMVRGPNRMQRTKKIHISKRFGIGGKMVSLKV